MRIERFEDIEAWQLARQLTCKVYDLTKKTRFARDFGLKGQIQDAAGSSMHNMLKDSIRRQTRSFFVFFGMPSGLAPKYRVSFT
jgi:four helix bundle protein